jgi:steroid 5-alpha reductase family enzyme
MFVILMLMLPRRGKDGNLAIRFLILFGAASIITESLRYDRFLSITFVGLQQVAAAVMLALGIALAVRRSNRPKSALAIAALISIVLMIGIVIGLEFALDRTTWNKFLLYAAMIIAVSVPAVLGFRLLRTEKKETRQ